MRYSTRTRWIATALAVGAIAAPAVQAADYHQPFGDTGGGSSPGGPAYGIVSSGLAPTAGGHSSGGPAFSIVSSGLAPAGGGQSSGGSADGVPVLQAPGDAIHTEIATRAAKPRTTVLTPTPAVTRADGFDWTDAGIGAGIGVAALLLAAAGARLRGYRLAHS